MIMHLKLARLSLMCREAMHAPSQKRHLRRAICNLLYLYDGRRAILKLVYWKTYSQLKA